MKNIEYIAAIDPGKKTSGMIIFDIDGGKPELSKEYPPCGTNPYTIETKILWENKVSLDKNYWLVKSKGIIVIETGYISQRNKAVTAEHILLCGKVIGGLLAKGYDVREASPLKWIPEMLSTAGSNPSRSQIAKMMKMRVEQMEPGVKFNEHQRAAYLIGLWYWNKLKLGMI